MTEPRTCGDCKHYKESTPDTRITWCNAPLPVWANTTNTRIVAKYCWFACECAAFVPKEILTKGTDQ